MAYSAISAASKIVCNCHIRSSNVSSNTQKGCAYYKSNCSKCCPSVLTQAHSRPRLWSIASSITCWCSRTKLHAADRHRFRSATSSMGCGRLDRHAPAWRPRLSSQLISGRTISVATGLEQWSAVSRILFDALLYAVKFVASFYQVQYEHIKFRCGLLCICVCFKFPGVCFC